MSSENTYGFVKRLEFIGSAIDVLRPRTILEFGCGTGNNVMVPLAKRYPKSHFVGVDSDATSIAFARKHHILPNVTFDHVGSLGEGPRFELIIASEVLEHVEDPGSLLLDLQRQLVENGHLIVTVPNGYGPFEMGSFVESLVELSGLRAIMRSIKRRVIMQAPTEAAVPQDTLAVSPHVNFFTHHEIRQLATTAGLEVSDCRPRTWLCGFGFDQIIRGRVLLDWNARIADKLPAWCSSGWMFTLARTSQSPLCPRYHRNWYARLRRYLNTKRWGVQFMAVGSAVGSGK